MSRDQEMCVIPWDDSPRLYISADVYDRAVEAKLISPDNPYYVRYGRMNLPVQPTIQEPGWYQKFNKRRK
jgi:hypothetical protein